MGIFSGTVLKDMKVATKQTTILSAKNKKSISEPNFTKSERKVHFGQFFFENDPLDKPNRFRQGKKSYLFKKMVEIAKW